MHHDDVARSTVDEADNTSGVSRRSLVRAGATVAWSVPLVQIATAAPALAAVSGPARLRCISFTGTRTNTRVRLNIGGIKNTGGTPTGQVTVVIRWPKKRPGQLAPRYQNSLSAGWTFAGKTGHGPWSFMFVSNAGVAPGHQTPPLTFSVEQPWSGAWSPFNLTATAFASGAGSSTATTQVK